MSDIAIRAENLSKRYRIGEREPYKALRDTLSDAIYAPFRRLPSLFGNSRSSIRNSQSNITIWALKDVSFEVKRGEVVGIIGRNGAGKTTLLKILSRITEPTEGYAEIQGRVGSLLEVGTGFHAELTGRENIYLNGAILGMKKAEIERKFDEIVAFAEVERFIDTPVKHYSSGMYVRLAFAVAAHLEPEILLVDEVLAVGDYAFQKKCLGKMGDVAKEGRTVLFVSHNIGSIQNLCTRGILLESGRVSMEGVVIAVINKYLDPGGEHRGEVSWSSPDVAPGDKRARLKAVRIVSDGHVTRAVEIAKEFCIEVDYWNLEPNRRRFVAIEIFNVTGILVFVSSNLPSASLTPDPWHDRPYPVGLFRTSCTVPDLLLNDGPYTVTVKILENNLPSLTESDHMVVAQHILSFDVQDTGIMRQEYTGGKWLGIVRPRLGWQTVQLGW